MRLQSITVHEIFHNVKASTLFELYTNAAKHEDATGSSALITDKLGEPFNLYNGFCFGENIEIKKNKLIVQAWRTEDWPDELDDSILVIRLIEEGNDTHLYLTHADLPVDMAEPLRKGWNDFYWSKWRTYLKQ
ncbi:MAG: SRPBCC domain-containing protein [Flammeovirgaceae bacterium]|jgi:activator of HSP90 ATPase|nr:SRPBCC domain-containing protein [Flammeovirgaceae bacterium]